LNVAKGANLAGMGRYTKSPEAFFWLAQISQLSLLSFLPDNIRANLLGGTDASDLTRTTQPYAKKVWSFLAPRKFEIKMIPDTAGSNHSEAIVAVDRWGNVAAIVHSINSLPWGNTGIFVDGVSIPDRATFQQQQILWAGRGKRLPDPTMPLIVSRGGKPVAALSAIGSGLHQTMLSALLNMLDFNMDLDQAIWEPSQHLPELKGSEFMPVVFEGDFSKELIAEVKKLGLDVDVITRFSPLAGIRGYVVGVAIDKTGRRQSVKNPASPGAALAY
jgi:gamma-glutamyltranspeptidase/glutathione hydrolase